LKCGDKNTKFFHACASQRRRKNFIYKIKDGRGWLWERGEEVENAFVEYFSNLYSSSNCGAAEINLQGLEDRVSNEMNTSLLNRNTHFFHAWASHRKRVNHIKKIIDDEDLEWSKPDDVGKIFECYYQNLFTSEGAVGIEECLEGLEECVTPDMNAWLMRPFVAEEVYFALSQMHPLKSSGPDGFAACFYQKAWKVVREEVCCAVLEFLNGGDFHNDINETYIALIPKIKCPTHVSEFRPISLCNVLYKLIAKTLANRLKRVLGEIISPNQSAFIPGRLITDNIIIAFEALHTMDTRMKGAEGYMALKLDMSKAYDRVEWNFLEAVMSRIGFDNRWVQLLMTCVRTVTYSVLINGRPYGKICPSRGLRQGDLLSPYLFILCA
jgi:hypothetical protein